MKQTRFVIQTAAAKMPISCWGKYRRVAVLEISSEIESAKMISERAKGVVRVVQTWEKLNVGKTKACAYQRALAEARALVNALEMIQS